MITKSDVVLLLTELQNKGIDVKNDIALVLSSPSIPLDILKKINDNRSLDILSFYEKLRQSHNNKRSKLYINIMKADENVLKDPKTVLTTLSALLNQILQFNAEDRTMFYQHARCDEILKVLGIYFKTYSLEPATKLLALYKADIVALEMMSGRRK